MTRTAETLALWDYRRRVADLYAAARRGPPGEVTWLAWHEARDQLVRTHPASPIPADRRSGFTGLAYFPYDRSWRCEAEIHGAVAGPEDLAHSGRGATSFQRFGVVRFVAGGATLALPVFWLTGYGGGVFLPFRDETNGDATYGGGRYLLDTAKGADLGHTGRRLVLDFNYSYHPSCVHDDGWSCPLPPPGSRVALPVTAGERLA